MLKMKDDRFWCQVSEIRVQRPEDRLKRLEKVKSLSDFWFLSSVICELTPETRNY